MLKRTFLIAAVSALLTLPVGACGASDADEHDADGGPECSCSIVDGSTPDAARPHDAGVDAPSDADAAVDAETTLLDLRAPREMRGLWVSTVDNIDFPKNNPDAAAARVQLAAIAERAKHAGLNALFFQVRPESDALYRSTIEPWSRYLTGVQGRDPGYDPLAILLEEAHARGLEVHAWVNPYRAKLRTADTTVEGHISRALASAAVTYNGAVTMDPSRPEVRTWLTDVLSDLLARYAVDGLHYDDYFYPYPDGNNTQFPDAARYTAYTQGGGALSRVEWRIDNVNQMVRATAELIQAAHASVRFGISPFGIYRPDPTHGITGLDAYTALACDAPRWVAEGWVDYITPQLYWTTTQTGQAFGTLAGLWAGHMQGEAQLYLGHGLYRLGSSAQWTFQELITQVAIGRGLRESGHSAVTGSVFFTAHDLEGREDTFASELFATRALPPELPRAARLGTVPPPVIVGRDATQVQLAPDAEPMVFRALYTQDEAGAWRLYDLVAGDRTEIEVPAGALAIANVRRGAVQSLAVPVPGG